jgi:hypothetical protein
MFAIDRCLGSLEKMFSLIASNHRTTVAPSVGGDAEFVFYLVQNRKSQVGATATAACSDQSIHTNDSDRG